MYASHSARGFKDAEKSGRLFVGKFDEKVRFEIDDSRARLKEEGLAALKAGRPTTLTKLLDHPELFQNYAFLTNICVNREIVGSNAAAYSRKSGEISFSEKEIFNTEMSGFLLHEIQHAIQHMEGLDAGGSPDVIQIRLTAEKRKTVRKMFETETDGVEATERWLKEHAKEISEDALAKYKAIPGEIEARDVTLRMKWSAEERSTTPPYSSEAFKKVDVFKYENTGGLEEQWTRFKFLAVQAVRRMRPNTEIKPKNVAELPAHVRLGYDAQLTRSLRETAAINPALGPSALLNPPHPIFRRK